MLQVAAGGVSGLTATALPLGVVEAWLATSTGQSAIAVLVGVATAGALVGGFVAVPPLNRLAWIDGSKAHDEESSFTMIL